MYDELGRCFLGYLIQLVFKTKAHLASEFSGLEWSTGLLDWTVGLDYCTGLLDWTTGLDYWTRLLHWITGLDYWTDLDYTCTHVNLPNCLKHIA